MTHILLADLEKPSVSSYNKEDFTWLERIAGSPRDGAFSRKHAEGKGVSILCLPHPELQRHLTIALVVPCPFFPYSTLEGPETNVTRQEEHQK